MFSNWKPGSRQAETTEYSNGTLVPINTYKDPQIGRGVLDGLYYLLPIVAQVPPRSPCFANGQGPSEVNNLGWSQMFLKPHIVQGLILQAIASPPPGCFQRVGCFSDHKEDIVSAMDDPGRWAKDSVYEESIGTFAQGHPEYYIKIV